MWLNKTQYDQEFVLHLILLAIDCITVDEIILLCFFCSDTKSEEFNSLYISDFIYRIKSLGIIF